MSQQAATNCIESVQQYCNYGYDENLYSSNSDCRRNKTCDSSQFGETTPYITPNDKRHSKVIKDSVVVWASLIGGYMLIEKGYKKKREKVLYLIVLLWLLVGLAAIYKGSNLSELAAYFAALSPFVIGYIYGETKRPSDKEN